VDLFTVLPKLERAIVSLSHSIPIYRKSETKARKYAYVDSDVSSDKNCPLPPFCSLS
jgi:hypothetical protein